LEASRKSIKDNTKMSAGLSEFDAIDTRADLGLSWHGLDCLKEVVTFADSPADFNVIQRPVEFSISENPIDTEAIANAMELRKFRSMKKADIPAMLAEIIGDVSRGAYPEGKVLVNERSGRAIDMANARYGVVQNDALFNAIENSLSGIPHSVTSIMTLDNQRKSIFALDIGEHGSVKNDEYKDFLTITNSLDGSWQVATFDNSIRVVCQNTLNMAFAENHGINLSIRHSVNAPTRIPEMGKALDALLARRKEFYANLNRLAEIRIDAETANRFMLGLLGNENGLSTRAYNLAENVGLLFTGASKLGIEIDGATRYGLFNAATQYWTRYSADTSEGLRESANVDTCRKQFSQSEFGTGSKRKAQVYESLISDEKLFALVEKGNALLAKYEEDHATAIITV
jgi:hypothetical protein